MCGYSSTYCLLLFKISLQQSFILNRMPCTGDQCQRIPTIWRIAKIITMLATRNWSPNSFCPLYLSIQVTKEHSYTLDGKMLLLTHWGGRVRPLPIIDISTSWLAGVPGKWCRAIGLCAPLPCPSRRNPTNPLWSLKHWKLEACLTSLDIYD